MSLPVTDLERSRAFYRDVLRLREIERPPFDFPGSWYAVGGDGAQLHLIGDPGDPTFREGKEIDPGDVHFGVRVPSFRAEVAFLESKGYTDGENMIVRPYATAGYPQLYILDPDGYVIEINAAELD